MSAAFMAINICNLDINISWYLLKATKIQSQSQFYLPKILSSVGAYGGHRIISTGA